MAQQCSLVLLSKALFLVLGFSTNVVLARILGASGLGEYYLGIAVIQIASIASLMGLDSGLVRHAPIIQETQPDQLGPLISFAGRVVLIVSTILGACLFVTSPWLAEHYYHSSSMTPILRVFGIYLPFFAFFRISGAAITAIKKAEITSWHAYVTAPTLFLILLGWIALTGGAAVSVIWMRMLSHAITSIFLILFLLRNIQPNVKKPFQEKRRLLSFSVPLTFVALSYMLLGQMDVMMLGYFVLDNEVGVYSICVRLAFFVVIGLEILNPIVSPHFSTFISQKDSSSLRAVFTTSSKWIAILATWVLCGLLIFSEEILGLFGEAFLMGTSLLIILGSGQFLNAACGPNGQLLVMSGRQKWEMINTAFMIVLNFSLNLYLIPIHGVKGAAWATFMTIGFINLAKMIEVKILLHLHPFSLGYIKSIFAILLAAIGTFLLKNTLSTATSIMPLLVLFLGCVLFTGLSLLLLMSLAFDESDYKAFGSLIKRS